LIAGAAAARRPFPAWGLVFVNRCSRRRVGGLSRRVRLLRRRSWRRVGGSSRRIRLLRRCSWRRRSIGAAQPRPFDQPPRLLIRPQQGVSVLGSLLEAALFELERRPVKLVTQFWASLPQPCLGQMLIRQALEPRDEAAVVGLHAVIPLLIRIVVVPSPAIAARVAFFRLDLAAAAARLASDQFARLAVAATACVLNGSQPFDLLRQREPVVRNLCECGLYRWIERCHRRLPGHNSSSAVVRCLHIHEAPRCCDWATLQDKSVLDCGAIQKNSKRCKNLTERRRRARG